MYSKRTQRTGPVYNEISQMMQIDVPSLNVRQLSDVVNRFNSLLPRFEAERSSFVTGSTYDSTYNPMRLAIINFSYRLNTAGIQANAAQKTALAAQAAQNQQQNKASTHAFPFTRTVTHVNSASQPNSYIPPQYYGNQFVYKEGSASGR